MKSWNTAEYFHMPVSMHVKPLEHVRSRAALSKHSGGDMQLRHRARIRAPRVRGTRRRSRIRRHTAARPPDARVRAATTGRNAEWHQDTHRRESPVSTAATGYGMALSTFLPPTLPRVAAGP
ncbi:hypothetical protein MRX96_017089 [Rhipicephalus microplus]